MIFHRILRPTNGTRDGREKACWMISTTGSAAWCAWLPVENRNRRRPLSIAKASNRQTSVAQRASTREKKVNGRKRHLLVDVMGLILVAIVTPASTQDRDGAVPLLQEAHREYPTLKHVWADGAYNGGVIDKVRADTGLTIEIVKRSDDLRGFIVLPRRWVVERTNGWLCKSRLLNKEYERTIQSSRADVLHAMTALMLRRLTTPAGSRKESRRS
jgi:transposase